MPRVLLVEDDPLVGHAMRLALSRHVTVVVVVHDAASAIQRLEGGGLDVVITDYDLGVASLDGIALAVAIRARWPAMPIVLATGSVNSQIFASALAAGVSECFTKPVATRDLVATLRRITTRPGADGA